MHVDPLSVGDVEVLPLCDAVGPMGESIRRPLNEMFPGASASAWRQAKANFPEVFGPAEEWILHFHCFLLRMPGDRTVLIDTGIGSTESPAAEWAPVPGTLLSALAAVQVEPADVDVVVLTHLHSDHAAGAVIDGVPAFPNARYLLQRRELDWIGSDPANPLVRHTVRPLRDAGCLDVVHGTERLGSAVEIVPTPGHTPGHQSVVVGDHRLVVTGDVVLHPVQLIDETVEYLYDDDAVLAAATRAELLRRTRDRNGVLAAPHLPAPVDATVLGLR